MKTKHSVLIGMVALAAVALPVQAETRVGVVNTVRLMEEAPQAKAAQTNIETEFAPREKELVALQKDVRALEDKLSRDGAVMSEKENSNLERDILSKRREIKRAQDEFRDDLNIRKNEILSSLQRQMYDATVELAKEKNFDVILGQGVVYSSDKVDITEDVLRKLKAGFKAGGGK
ncbi:MAG: OmpH family outer membrane protein [Thiogranum sp.]|nr:OmpH family outer membrane protein [Thiogranum sp.]